MSTPLIDSDSLEIGSSRDCQNVSTMTTMTATGTRGTRMQQKWHYLQSPTPRILHLPGRGSRRKPPPGGRPSSCNSRSHRHENHARLEVLLDRERALSKGDGSKGGGAGGGSSAADEECRFQAEVLRAECNLLRIEKEVAVRKLDRSRVYLERTLRSAIEALISGRKRICEGKSMATVIDEEIQNLVDKLKEIGRSSRAKSNAGARKSSTFDRQADPVISGREEGGACSGQCRAVVWRIVEQVRAEAEQWSRMQELLRQVRDEMEELQASRDFWEDRALGSDTENQSLRSSVQEWRQRALSSEGKATELQVKASMLRDEIDSLNKVLRTEPTRSKHPVPLVPSRQNETETEKRVLICSLKENHQLVGLDTRVSGVDGRMKVCSCTGSRGGSDPKRSPLRDIGNSSSRNAESAFPLSYHLSYAN